MGLTIAEFSARVAANKALRGELRGLVGRDDVDGMREKLAFAKKAIGDISLAAQINYGGAPLLCETRSPEMEQLLLAHGGDTGKSDLLDFPPGAYRDWDGDPDHVPPRMRH